MIEQSLAPIVQSHAAVLVTFKALLQTLRRHREGACASDGGPRLGPPGPRPGDPRSGGSRQGFIHRWLKCYTLAHILSWKSLATRSSSSNDVGFSTPCHRDMKVWRTLFLPPVQATPWRIPMNWKGFTSMITTSCSQQWRSLPSGRSLSFHFQQKVKYQECPRINVIYLWNLVFSTELSRLSRGWGRSFMETLMAYLPTV